jgi:hypothetical protein
MTPKITLFHASLCFSIGLILLIASLLNIRIRSFGDDSRRVRQGDVFCVSMQPPLFGDEENINDLNRFAKEEIKTSTNAVFLVYSSLVSGILLILLSLHIVWSMNVNVRKSG